MDLLKNIDVGIFILNLDLSVFYVNEIVSYLSTQKTYINCIHADNQDQEIKYYESFIKYKINSKSTCKISYNNDNNYVRVKITRVYQDKKYIFTFQDIDDFEYKSMVLATQNHELRTPLNGIIGMITLLEDTDLQNDQKDYINMLKECSINLLSIINDILDFSKLEAGKIALDVKCSNLRKCIESVNDIILSKLIDKNDIEYNFIISPSIPEYIDIDVNRLKQVLLNLLNNAFKFTDKGNIFLNIESINNSIKFNITDTGCGIGNDDRVKLFKSFSQIENGKMNEGTGLGLTIAKSLVNLMNGKIWLESSEINKGSKFCFTIKTSECIPLIEDDIINNQIFKNKKVLILDDNRENRLGLCNLISKWGMIPQPFSSAIEALYLIKLQKIKFDIGLIDVYMPEMSGKDFAIKLQKQLELDNSQPITLVALSSLGNVKDDYEQYFKAQLIKPVKESKLKQICYDILIKHPNKVETFEQDTFINLNMELKENIYVLLVEDVIINQKVVLKFLNKLGYINIDIVDDGKKCLEMLSKKKYDLILLDIKMPILNGELVFQYIINYYKQNNGKEEYKLMNMKKPYIIAVTAYSLKEDQERYLKLGFDAFIPKPINIKLLENSMNTFIDYILKN